MKDSTRAELATQLMLNKAGILKTAKITGGVMGDFQHVTKAELLEGLKAIENPSKEIQERIEELQTLIAREQGTVFPAHQCGRGHVSHHGRGQPFEESE